MTDLITQPELITQEYLRNISNIEINKTKKIEEVVKNLTDQFNLHEENLLNKLVERANAGETYYDINLKNDLLTYHKYLKSFNSEERVEIQTLLNNFILKIRNMINLSNENLYWVEYVIGIDFQIHISW